MNPRLRKLSLIALRALAVLAMLLILATVTVWGLRTQVATYLAKDYLRGFGIENPQLSFSKLNTDSLTLESVKIEYDGSQFTASQVELSYALSELFESYRIQQVSITGATLTIEPPEHSDIATHNEPEIPSIAQMAELLDLSALHPLPFNRIQISDSSIILQSNNRSVTSSLDAALIAESPQTLSLQSTLTNSEGSLKVDATLSTPHESSIVANLHLPSPNDTFDTFLPQWRESLPQLETLTTGALDARIALFPNRHSLPELALTLTLNDLKIDDGETKADIPHILFNTNITAWNSIPIYLVLVPQRLSYDTLTTSPNTPVHLIGELSKQSVVEIRTYKAIPISYDAGFIETKLHISAKADLSRSPLNLEGTITPEDFLLDGTPFELFHLSFEGNPQELRFQSSPIALLDFKQASLDAGSGTLSIPDSADAPITVHFSSVLRPAPIDIGKERANIPPFDLSLETRVYETSSQSHIELDAQTSDALLRIPEVASLQGQLSIKADISEDSLTELLSGEFNLDASNISIQSAALNGDGVALQSKLRFQNVSTEELTNDSLTDTNLLADLLKRTQANIDWQANQLQAEGVDAQWSGGSVELKNDGNEFIANLTFGAGILKADSLRLEQLYLENEHRGTLDQISGQSTVTAMLDGATLQVDSQQSIKNPLSALSLSGEYTLSPITFTHSDLLSRFEPELAGLSFSGDLNAAGKFNFASAENADATLSLSLRDGSFAYPASQLNARDLQLDLSLASLRSLDSGAQSSTLHIGNIEAGDLRSITATSEFKILQGQTLAIDSASVSLFGGQAKLRPTEIPIDGSDFQSTLDLDSFDLDQIASYVEIFDGQMQGKVSGYLPFCIKDGRFELLRGDLRLPDGSPASLKYKTEGLLTEDSPPGAKLSFSERLLKFLEVDPDLAAEQALGDITITAFETELFPEDDPQTPIRIRLEGTAHSPLGDIPVVINTQVHGSLSEFYNFLIRLNSL